MNGRRFGACLGALLMVTGMALAADRSDRLRTDLTPLGGERAGNAAGSIPPWSGAAPAPPAGWSSGQRYTDPFPDEKPLYVITADNAAKYGAQLSAGEQALLAAHPGFELPVYPSHRDAVAPQAFYDGTLQNAVKGYLGADSRLPENIGTGIPFPVLGYSDDAGLKAIWNHRLRWRGAGRDHAYYAATVATSGAVDLIELRERLSFRAWTAPPLEDSGRVLAASMLTIVAPEKIAGALKLIHETVSGPARAWQRTTSPGQSLFREIHDGGGDTPVMGSNGLLSEDQREGFAGSPDHYDWRLIGKRELIVPYDAYRLHAPGLAPPALLSRHQPSPAALRYELHRVWVLEARLKPNTPGLWPRRTLYLDEDSWQVLMADYYGPDDSLRRVEEVHTLMAWDQALLLPVLEVSYDLASSRYLALGVDNQLPGEIQLGPQDIADFTRAGASRWARAARHPEKR